MNSEENDLLADALDRFVVESMDSGCVWGLEGPEGWGLCASEKYDTSDVMPLWSDRESARAHCREEWDGYQPVAIDLEEFLDEWLPGMHEDVLLVGVNWNSELEGDEMEPLDLLEEFQEEMAP